MLKPKEDGDGLVLSPYGRIRGTFKIMRGNKPELVGVSKLAAKHYQMVWPKLVVMAVLMVLFIACGVSDQLLDRKTASCIAPDDMALFGSDNCDMFFFLNDAAATAFAKNVKGWDLDRVHAAFAKVDAVAVITDGGQPFTDVYGLKRYGEDAFWDHELDFVLPVKATDEDWASSAFVHELAHQLDADLDKTVDYDHAHWGDPDHAVWNALTQATVVP